MQQQPKTPSTKGPSQLFTGDVWFDVIAAGEPPSRLRVNLVRFAPGAHTAWHRHANGQTLHVTDGIGLVGTRDGQVIVMHPGDTVHTPPGEWHWHGAAPEHFMAHLAMWESLAPDQDGPETEWAEHLTDAQYPGTTSPLTRPRGVADRIEPGQPPPLGQVGSPNAGRLTTDRSLRAVGKMGHAAALGGSRCVRLQHVSPGVSCVQQTGGLLM